MDTIKRIHNPPKLHCFFHLSQFTRKISMPLKYSKKVFLLDKFKSNICLFHATIFNDSIQQMKTN